MNDAANLSNSKLENKLSIIKNKLPNVDENKLKSLEARFIGPSSNGNLPYEYDTMVDVNYDFIKSKFSNKSDTNTLNNDSVNEGTYKNLVDKEYFQTENLNNFDNNNSNKSNNNNASNNNNLNKNSARKKNESIKAEKKTKFVGGVCIDYLSTKRARNDSGNNLNNNSNCDNKNPNDKQGTKEHEIKEDVQNDKNSNYKQNSYFTSNNNPMNSPSNSKQKKISLNSNNPNNILNNFNNENINNQVKPMNLKESEIYNKTSPTGNNILTNNILNSTNNNLNNLENLNNVINLQNANFINSLQDISYESVQGEENIEFSSKNVVSSANLFYKTKDASGNIIITKANPALKNQTLLDHFTTKNFGTFGNNSNNRNNDTKINSYFNKMNSNNSNQNLNNSLNLSNEDKNSKILKRNYIKLVEDNEKLIKELGDKNKFLYEKEKENEKLKLILIENDESIKNLNILNKNFENQVITGRKTLIKYLRDFEDLKRSQTKLWLNEQAYRLGRFSIQRAGTRLIEVWEDGVEINSIKNNLKEIKNNKEDLEKFKKRLALAIKKRDSKDKDKEKEKEKEKESLYNIGLNNSIGNTNNNFLHPNNIYHSNNFFSGNVGNFDDYSEHDMIELRELINFKLTKMSKDETECLEKLEKLEIEKIKYQIEFKRNIEEEKCRYGTNSKDKWPILSNRYLILSLLGRGGYSEVYKAYDLENHIEVACKIHQLNPTWSDSIKENYIRHTIRENQIHKEINHAKVVRHYDTIEIDTSSFCTVLELCSGPDLYTYLKLNKTLSERDARIIISQILSGVEYLNKLQKKIIHYDLKPQNIIFNNMEVKISDFGLAKIMEDNSDKIELTSQGVGTYWYLPPECFDTDKNPPGISSKVDVWSIGVILFELVFGIRPFGHTLTQDRILKENVITNAKKVEFPQKPVVSDECKDFIKHCLAHNQDERYDVFEALESSFIKGINQKKTKN